MNTRHVTSLVAAGAAIVMLLSGCGSTGSFSNASSTSGSNIISVYGSEPAHPLFPGAVTEAGGGKVKLRNVLADKVIDLVGMRVENGTQAQIWQDVFGENQLWKLDPVPERLLNKETPAPTPAAKKPAKTTRTQTEKKNSGKAARRSSKNK